MPHTHNHNHVDTAAPTFSLLRLSAVARLGGVAVIVALLWAAVGWAL